MNILHPTISYSEGGLDGHPLIIFMAKRTIRVQAEAKILHAPTRHSIPLTRESGTDVDPHHDIRWARMRIRCTLQSSTVAIHGFLSCFCLKSGAFDAPEGPRVCPETTDD